MEMDSGYDRRFLGGFVLFFLTAKGWPYAVICTESDSEEAAVVEHRLIYNESYRGEGYSEYVYQKYFLDESGNQVKEPQIMGFFLVDAETLEILEKYCKKENISKMEGIRRGIRKLDK